MVVTPSSAHAEIARLRAAPEGWADRRPAPGRTCGALEFVKVMRDNGCTADVTVAEAETFIYASRSDGPAQARIFRIKEAVPLAALPATRTHSCWMRSTPAYPQFIDGVNVLNTGLNNMGAIFHPGPDAAQRRLDRATHGDYQFYIDGVTPSVARMLEVLDRERVTVARRWASARARAGMAEDGLRHHRRGPARSHSQPARLLRHQSPPTLNHRYIFEDVPMSLVPIASLGQRYGVSVRGMESIIRSPASSTAPTTGGAGARWKNWALRTVERQRADSGPPGRPQHGLSPRHAAP
jgi:opine dehydrogenase